MSPFRLLVLGVLFYLLYRLFFSRRPSESGGQRRGKSGGGHALADDVLVEDPVCHVYVPRGQALQTRDAAGTTHYFCSSGCRDRYLDQQQGEKK
ncbi:MAG: TRASH domain protein [Thermodesulfobacteriota bacterium]